MPVHDWSDDLGVRCLGVDLIIRSRGPELAIAVREAWRDAEVVVDGPDVPTVTVGLGLASMSAAQTSTTPCTIFRRP